MEIDDGYGILVGMDDKSLEELFGIKTNKCRYCDKSATKRVMFNGGRGAINVCDSHPSMAKRAVTTQGYDVDSVEGIGEGKAAYDQPGLGKCEKCKGVGEFSNGKECDNCDGSGYVEGKAGGIDTDPDPSPNPGATRLREYWVHGEGSAKIRWGVGGDFNRCVRHLRKYVGTRAEGLCNVFHRSALGAAPGHGHGKSETVSGVLDRIGKIELKYVPDDKGPAGTAKTPAKKTGANAGEDARDRRAAAAKKTPAKKAPAKKTPAKKTPQNNNSDFNSKHPRGPGGKFAFKKDTGKGAAERGTMDANAAPDGKVHGRIGRAQANLVALGLLDKKAGEKGNAVDGKFGANTQRAILAFQKKYKLQATGKLDPATEKAINSEMLKRKKAPAAKTAAAKKTSSSKTPTPPGKTAAGSGKKSLIATKSFAFTYEKRDYSQTSRDKMSESGEAMSDGSFPIANTSDLQNAIQSVGRAKDVEAAKKHIMKRAKDLDAEDMIPEGWRNGGKSLFGTGVGSIYEHKDGSTGVEHIEYKGVTVSGVKELGGENSGLVEAIVSVTGIVDNVKDIIKPGAYAKSLITRIPKGVWHHNWQEPVARTEGVKELYPGDADLPATLPNGQPWPAEAGALKVVTRFNLDTQRGREAYADVKFFGQQQEWSIGYNVPVGGADIDTKTGVRTINTLDLFEYSPVLFGAMPVARTASIKSAQQHYAALRSALSREELLMEAKELLNLLDEPPMIEGEEKAGKVPPAQDEEELDEEMKPGDDEDQGMEDDEMMDEEEEDEETEGKAMPMSAAQLDLVQSAISALQKLADSMSGSAAPSEDTAEEKMKRRKRGGGSAACKSLEELVSQVFDDESVISDAKAFDAAVEAADLPAAEEAASAVLDVIEDAVDNGVDADFSPATDYIAENVTALQDSEGGDEEDTTDEEDEDTGTGEKVSVPLTEFKGLFDGLGVTMPLV